MSKYYTKAEVEKMATNLTNIFWILGSVLAVGFLSVLITGIGFIIDAYRFKSSSYQSLSDKVNEQNVILKNMQEQQSLIIKSNLENERTNSSSE